MRRPHNHVTGGLVITRHGPTSLWPEVPEDLLRFLEGVYPPRCYEPGRETLETHLQYAGASALVRDMRDAFETRRANPSEADAEGS